MIASSFARNHSTMRRTLLFISALFIIASSTAQDIGARSIELQEVVITGMPGLQSFAWGQDAGQWFLIGGRTDGLHQRQPFAAFLAADNNTMAYVVDPISEQVWSASVTSLPTALKEQLQSTNTEFLQRGSTLYVIGGYGFSATANDHITYPELTAIDLPGAMNAIRTGATISPFFRQITDTRLEVTGGQLGLLEDRFILAGGQRFIGRYNPMGPNQGPGFIQEYTDAIRRFRIDDDGVNLSITDYTEDVDTMELHRRDYNMLPQRFPNGEFGYTIFSGVFQHNNNIPWLNTVDVRAADWNVVPVFDQLLNQYHTAHAALWDSTMNRMDNVFFGGMSRYHYNGANLTDDTNVPFVSTISRVSRDASGQLTEAAVGAMPGLLGASAEFIPLPGLATSGDGIIRSDLLGGDNVLIGHIVGGIQSTAPNIFFVNTGTQSDAAPRIFEVWLVDPSTGTTTEPVPVTNTLQVVAVPGEDRIRVRFHTTTADAVRLELLNAAGQFLKTIVPGRVPPGDHEIQLSTAGMATGHYTIVLTVGEQLTKAGFIK